MPRDWWGAGSFDNRAAQQWVLELEDADDLEMVESTFDELIEQDEHGHVPELSDCSVAIAAAETVAALSKTPSNNLPEEVRQWCFDNPDLELRHVKDKAVQALSVIITESELKALMEKSGMVDGWEESLEGLRDRLLEM